jgi:hypothetical protein
MPALTPDQDTPLDGLLRFQHGVISWRQARRHLTESAITHRVASGRWRRMHLGVYLTYGGPVTRAQRWWIASLAVGNGRPALLAGLTALRVHGLRLPGLRLPEAAEPVHLVLPAHLTDRNPPAGAVVHRSRRLSRDDACLDMSPPCTTAARSLVDAAQWALDDTAAISVVAATFQQRLVTLDQVHTVLASSRRVRRRPVIESAVADAGGGAESAYEIGFLRLCRLAGLPRPSRQAVRRDRSGRNRYRDVYFDPWKVQVEIDGSQHMETRGWFADMRSGNEIAISGVRLLRFPGWAVRHRPDEVIGDVRAALEAAGWRGEPQPAGSRGRRS